MRTNKRTFAEAEIVPRSVLEPLDTGAIFGRTATLEIDLGCGDGSFLVALAQQMPERNFIGVERMAGRVRSACRKIGSLGLTNAKIVQDDVLHAVQQLFAPGSIGVLHLMFPDPWPKRRHNNRRVVTPEFLRAAWRALKTDGQLRVATDHPEYFAAIHDALLRVPLIGLEQTAPTEEMPPSTFEERFRASGLAIHRLWLRKRSFVR